MTAEDRGRLWCCGQHLEYVFQGPPPAQAPTLVFLHEGLGCVSLWRDFPQAVAAATGCGVLVYSRLGYGRSDPVALPRPLHYMHDEALVLPHVLDAAGVRRAVLVGHSDGASIAIIHAGGVQRSGRADGRLVALVLLAPHVFCEDVSVRSIAAAREAFDRGDLRQRLLRHHGDNTDGAFWGWCGAWLDPGFRLFDITEYLPWVRLPVLVIQGQDDEYGTLRQVDTIAAQSDGPVERLVLPACRHSPHRDQPQQTLAAIAAFVTRPPR